MGPRVCPEPSAGSREQQPAASVIATATELGEAFAAAEVKAAGIESCMSRADGGKSRNAELVVVSDPIHRQRVGGYFGRIFSSGFPGRTSQSKKAGVQQHLVSRSLTVSDFDLLRVVGKGAFGKVMLVRKKAIHTPLIESLAMIHDE